MKSLRNLVSRRANKAMLDHETDNTETSYQTDISVGGQDQKTKSRIKEIYPNRTRRDKRGRNTGGARRNCRTK